MSTSIERPDATASAATSGDASDRGRVCLVVESGCDVRLVDGLAAHHDLVVIARRIDGGVEVSHPPTGHAEVIVGPPSRVGFAGFVWSRLGRESRRIDAIIAQGYGLAALAANAAARRRGIPSVSLVCSPVELYYECRREHPVPGKPYRRSALAAIRAVARANALIARRYVVLGNHLADVIRGHGWRGPVDVIPIYGVDTRIFSATVESKETIRARLQLPLVGRIIFFSSRIAPEKDAEALLRAVRKLRDRGRDLWILHRSGAHAAFVRDAERFGLEDRVIAGDALHPHDGLADAYRASDLCVQASRAEGLGFSPLEALACGTPVVATAVGGLRETIIDGETGWSYPRGDVDALASAIGEALDNPAEAARRASRGRALVASSYDSRLVFDRFTSVLCPTPRR